MTTPQIIITLSPEGKLVAELPGLNGSRRKINLETPPQTNQALEVAVELLRSIGDLKEDQDARSSASKAEALLNSLQNKIQRANEVANAICALLNKDNTISETLTRILDAQLDNKVQLGEDGAPTQAQVKHWEKHSGIWGDPSCSFCRAEGKFDLGKNREKSVRGLTKHEAMKLGLVSRGYKEQTKGVWVKANNTNLYLQENCKIFDGKTKIFWSGKKIDALTLEGKIHAIATNFRPQEAKPILKRKGVVVKRVVTKLKSQKVLTNISF